MLKGLLFSSIQAIWQVLEIHAAVSQSKRDKEKSTYTGAHMSDHISRDHRAIFKLQLRGERDTLYLVTPDDTLSEITWQIQMHSIPILRTEKVFSRGCWGTSIHRVNPLSTFAKSSWQIWNTAARRSVHDCALSQQTHQKGCRHSDSFITSSPPLLFLHLHHTSFPTHIQSMY